MMRASRTPWPTPEIRDDQLLTLASTVNDPTHPGTDKSLVVRGIQIIRTAAGGLEGLGEVFNGSDAAIANVQVRMELRDEAGAALRQKTILVARNVISAGQTSPFRVHFSEPPANTYSVDVVALPGDRIDSTNFADIVPTALSGYQEGRTLTIRGELVSKEPPIKYTVQVGDTLLGIAAKLGISVEQLTEENPGVNADTLQVGSEITAQVYAANVRLLATAYDDQKRVIGFRYMNVEQPSITSGYTIPFTVTMLIASPTIANFSVIAEAQKQ